MAHNQLEEELQRGYNQLTTDNYNAYMRQPTNSTRKKTICVKFQSHFNQ